MLMMARSLLMENWESVPGLSQLVNLCSVSGEHLGTNIPSLLHPRDDQYSAVHNYSRWLMYSYSNILDEESLVRKRCKVPLWCPRSVVKWNYNADDKINQVTSGTKNIMPPTVSLTRSKWGVVLPPQQMASCSSKKLPTAVFLVNKIH